MSTIVLTHIDGDLACVRRHPTSVLNITLNSGEYSYNQVVDGDETDRRADLLVRKPPPYKGVHESIARFFVCEDKFIARIVLCRQEKFRRDPDYHPSVITDEGNGSVFEVRLYVRSDDAPSLPWQGLCKLRFDGRLLGRDLAKRNGYDVYGMVLGSRAVNIKMPLLDYMSTHFIDWRKKCFEFYAGSNRDPAETIDTFSDDQLVFINNAVSLTVCRGAIMTYGEAEDMAHTLLLYASESFDDFENLMKNAAATAKNIVSIVHRRMYFSNKFCSIRPYRLNRKLFRSFISLWHGRVNISAFQRRHWCQHSSSCCTHHYPR